METAAEQHPCDIDLDLDLDIPLSTYDQPLYNLHQLALQYTYDGDIEKVYAVSKQAITPVIRRLAIPGLLELSLWVDVLRYTVQQEIDRRGIGDAADQLAARFFKKGQPLGTYDREHGGRQTKTATPVDLELFADLDDLEL